MLALDRGSSIPTELPLLTRLGILPFFIGAVIAVLAQLAGPEPAHPGPSMVELGHLVILAGMVLVLAGVALVGVRRHLVRRSTAPSRGGHSDAHR